MRRLAVLLILFLGAGCSVGPDGAEILWDTWGIPHIYAKDAESLFYAFGYAQGESHGDLILRLYGQARGRGAEYWGEEYADADRWVRTMGVQRLAREWLEAQSPEGRKRLDAFAAGLNAYVREHPDKIDDEVEVALPVETADVLAHSLRAIHFTFVANPRRIEQRAGQWRQAGSNTWAIAPSRAAGGHAMLLANPHLAWSDFYLWYEAQLTAPELNAYGATLVGTPILCIAFNDHLGWSHTVNTHDGEDLYELTLDGDGYRWDGGKKSFEQEEQVLKIRQADGSLRDEKLIIKRSVHGPVVKEKAGKALAVRVVGLDQPGMFEQYWDMLRARNLEEFEAALRRLQIPMFTVMYADCEGHIMHLFGGRTPVRPSGSWQDWQRPVAGDTSATLWSQAHPYEDLPKVVDPPSGWLQNANDPPWTTTFPLALDPSEFPPYMAPKGMSFRAQRSARMLDEDNSITFEEMIQCKLSTRMELADRILDALLEAARKQGSPVAKRGAGILAKWDRCAEADSRGAVLFEAFVREWQRRSGKGEPFAVVWSEEEPRSTPRGLASPSTALAALEAAVSAVEKQHGAADVAWGEVYRLRHGDLDLPANGGSGALGIFRAVGFDDFEARAGDSYVAVIEFSQPVRARALVSYGNSSQPGSPHAVDQLPLFANKQLRDVWLTREQVEAHLESKKLF